MNDQIPLNFCARGCGGAFSTLRFFSVNTALFLVILSTSVALRFCGASDLNILAAETVLLVVVVVLRSLLVLEEAAREVKDTTGAGLRAMAIVRLLCVRQKGESDCKKVVCG